MKSVVILSLAAVLAGYALGPRSPAPLATGPELVATYSSLADGLLALRKTEAGVVHSILSSTYQRAERDLARALERLNAKESPKAEVESLAAAVAELGNEGDGAVAGIRKRLIEGGHHHHQDSADSKSPYDDGFVVVTRDAKKALLDSAAAIGRFGANATADQLNAEWSKVKSQWDALAKSAR